jgi:hypothetical protein
MDAFLSCAPWRLKGRSIHDQFRDWESGKKKSPLLARLRRPLHKILSLAKLAFFQLKSDRKVNSP